MVNREMGRVSEDTELRRKLVTRLSLYPLILVICFTPITILRVFEFAFAEYPSVLYYTSGLFASSVGWVNAIVYGLNGNVRSALRNSCRPHSEPDFGLEALSLDFSESEY